MKPIDAVITWVDGDDPKHLNKLQHYCKRQPSHEDEHIAKTRFSNSGELKYCLQAIFTYAPWIRKIFIVTDNQIPQILQELAGQAGSEKIEIVDHKVIFQDFETNLPTFNSISIETMLWRIPQLADQFIYFNDDVILTKPALPSDFFQEEQVVLRGQWKVFYDKNIFYRMKGKTPPINRMHQENSAKLVGFKHLFFYIPHIPFPMRRQVFIDFFAENPHLLGMNSQFPIRAPEQFWPVGLAHGIEIKKHHAIFDSSSKMIALHGLIHPHQKIVSRLNAVSKNKNFMSLCLQSLDLADYATQEYIFRWLDERFCRE